MAGEGHVPEYLKTHHLREALLHFAVRDEERALRDLAASSGSGRAAKTLVKEGPLRITLAALRKGATLETHQITGPVSIHALSGRLRVSTPAALSSSLRENWPRWMPAWLTRQKRLRTAAC